MTTPRASTNRVFNLVTVFALVAGVGAAHAGGPTDDVTARTQRTRNGAGLQISSWQPEEPAGFLNSGTVAFQGYFQKGLDLHLAWENNLGYWRRTSSWTETPPLAGTTSHELQTHLVPMLTALRLYPFTTPTSPIEPFLCAGAGPVLGVQQHKSSGSLASDNTTSMYTGLGVKAGAGVDVRANEVFGITAGGHFESASFGQDIAGDRLYRAWGVDVGLSYRFQYR